MEKDFKKLAEKLCKEKACHIQSCLQGNNIATNTRAPVTWRGDVGVSLHNMPRVQLLCILTIRDV